MDLHDGLIPLVDEGLGNSAYLIDLGDGRALAVDPSLDLRAVDRTAAKRGLRIAYAAETHLHADFLSGARQLSADHDAHILASAAGNREFGHTSLADGDEVDLGGLTLRALETPGHTPEHLSYLILDGTREVGVFTGGSLIVGAAARTDLVGSDRTEQLARAQYRSLRRLAELPDATAVWPTHGAGSFCSAPPGSARTSTIGAEKAANALLAAPGEDTFVTRLLASLGSYPAYFDRLAEVNRRGPDLITTPPTLVPLDPARVRTVLADGGYVVDVRPVADYAAGHIPGSVSIPLRAQYATWLGWLLPPDAPIVIVRDPGQEPDDILWPALNIGYASIAGELAGGVAAWAADGGDIRATRLVKPGGLDTPVVVDVRQHSEHDAGHLPSAELIELGDLAGHTADLPNGPATVMCGHGERAATAASILERAGRTDLSIMVGGPNDWATATGRALDTSG
ncbi:MBL fold metallo-hydrolase [Micromonospora sp. CPCC 206061]|uniref:MBL fold metallo-hydrolase n=1 Tax=Micromonospora sp. CPCC 206061 TaxID=3122410 RepID=UPI002FF2A7EC